MFFIRMPVTNIINSFIIFIVLVFCLCTYVKADDNLTLAVHPYLPTDELFKKFNPLVNYLSAQVGQTINVRVGSSYDEHIRYIGQDKVDIAYMGPASFVKLGKEYGEKPILARLEVKGNPWFQGNIIALKDGDISKLDDLKGKRIAYGDPSSTMSYIVPNHMLHKAGIFNDPTTTYQFLNSHKNVAFGVLSGDFDAGAVKPAVFKKFEYRGLITIAKTPQISEHLFITRANLSPEMIEKLRNAMFNISKSKEGLAALHSIKKSITGLVKAENTDYQNLRIILKESSEINKK